LFHRVVTQEIQIIQEKTEPYCMGSEDSFSFHKAKKIEEDSKKSREILFHRVDIHQI
jgi:hypothetical protein